MQLQRLRAAALTTLGWLAVTTTSSALLAQQPPEPDGRPQPQVEIREQTIYIPYSKLRETFEKHGRGVFLPYEKFQALWTAARDKQPAQRPDKVPVAALITEVHSEAVVAEQVVQVSAAVKIDLLAPGWQKIPLRLGDAAIGKAEIDGQPARLIAADDGSGYQLLIEKRGEQPERVELHLEYARSFTASPGENHVSFAPPLAPVNRWTIRVPESGVRVDVEPMLATTEVPAAEGDNAEETVVLAFVGAAPRVRIEWTPKSEGAAGLEALTSVQSQQEVRLDEGVLRTRTQLTYEISRAELTQLIIEAPADHKVAGVFDANIRQWQVAVEDDIQRITAELFQPAKDQQQVVVELEKFIAEADQSEIVLPMVQAIGVGRQQGFVVVQIASSLRAEVIDRQGLTQTDLTEMPTRLAKGDWTFAFRYAAIPYALTLRVEKVQPHIQVQTLIEAYLEPERVSVDLLAVYDIERAGVFELQLDIPAGYEVREVRGHAAQKSAQRAAPEAVQPAVVDAHYLEVDEKTRLRVNLGRKALGKIGLLVQLEKLIDDPNLLSPTGKAAAIELALPRVASDSVERRSGRLVLYGPESLRLTAQEHAGLRSISFQEAWSEVGSVRQGRFPGLRPVLAYAYAQEPVDLTISAERRKPYVTVQQLLVVRVDAGVVKYDATITYNILYSGVKSLRLNIPADLAGQIHNATSSLREKRIDPPPADLQSNYVAWSLSGESELIGDVTLRLTWEQPVDKIDVGKSVDLKIPELKPADVERAWGQVVVIKTEMLDVRPADEPEGMRPIDPQHDLMAGASVPDAAMAFEFQEDWRLVLRATRYQLETVKHTSIERAVLRMVVTRSDQISVQVLYRLRSAHQRLAVQLPEQVQFDTEPLRINGRPVPLERGDQGKYFVPLVGSTPNEPLVLELRYTIEGDASRLDFPTFPENAAVQKVYLCAYLPQELAWLGSRGPWNDEHHWYLRSPFDWRPTPNRSDMELVNWVTEGIDAGNPREQFQTDGRFYLFSTLRPAPPPAGALRLVTLNERWLSALVFVGVALVGLALVRFRLSLRLLALAGFAVLLMMLGVFLPTFARQIFDWVLFAAVLLVLALWLAVYLLRERPLRRVVDEPTSPAAASPGGGSHA